MSLQQHGAQFLLALHTEGTESKVYQWGISELQDTHTLLTFVAHGQNL